MKSISTTGTPWDSKHQNNQGWETESNAFSQVHPGASQVFEAELGVLKNHPIY